MWKWSLCDYSDAYILVKGRITIDGDAGPETDSDSPRKAAQLSAARQGDERNKEVT